MNPLQLIGGAYLARSRSFDASRLVNLYPEASGSGQSKAIAMLIGSPGLRLIAAGASGGVRGFIRFTAATAFVVVGGNVYSMTTAGVLTLIGTVVNRTTPVSMASNGQVVMMVTGPEGYVITPASGINPAVVAPIIDPDFVGADTVTFLDQYFAFNQPGTSKFQITGLLTTDIDPLDFATAEGAPDLLITLQALHEELWLLGETSTEVFFNSGDADFPLSRIQGAFMEQGCAAKYSATKCNGNMMWLSQNDEGQNMVVKSQGYTATRISTHALEYAIAQYARTDDAIGFSYQAEGHFFYILVFPTGNATWVFDDNTQLWHERQWRNPADGSMNRIRGQCVMAFGGKTWVGDWENGNIYQWDLDVYDDFGGILPAIRQVPHMASANNVWQFFHRIWIDMQTGVGLVVGQGSDPQLLLEWSDDGGYSFPNAVMVPIGKLGERKARAVARRLGKSRDRVWRVTITDPVKRILIGAGVDMTEGSS